MVHFRQEKFGVLFEVPQQDSGLRLDKCLAQYFKPASFVAVQKACRKGLVRVNGKKVKDSGLRLQPGDAVLVPGFLTENVLVAAESDTVQKPLYQLSNEDKKHLKEMVIYEDDAVLVINKPYGLPVQAGSGHSKSLDRMLVAYYGQQQAPKLVHRLDKNTTGCLLFAKTAAAARVLAKNFKSREMEKIYWCVCRGRLKEHEGVCTMRLQKMGGAGKEKVAVDAEGQTAVTYWRKVASSADYNWLEAQPKTGRTHQIRVHMAYLGVPLIGDVKYGGEKGRSGQDFPKNKMFLHARQIGFLHPISGHEVRFTAPLPEHFTTVFKLMDWREKDAQTA